MQKEVVGHETENKPELPPGICEGVHVDPFQVNALPALFTAIQKVADKHEIVESAVLAMFGQTDQPDWV
jgi:hypothetical protein